MTVPNENAVTSMSWTGAQTSFAPGFNAQSVDHVFVRFINVAGIESPLQMGVHYSVSLSASQAVTIVPIALPPPPGTLKIYRTTPATQGTSFVQLNKYAPETHERLHDASALRDAEIRANLAGLVNVPAQIITDLLNVAPRTFLGNSRNIPGAFEQMPPTTAKNVLGIAVSDVIGLQTALNNKANLVHTHAIADVIGLQAQLDAILAGVGLPSFRRATYPLLAAEITQPDDTLGMVYADTSVHTTQRARNANIATITTATPHNYTTNRKVNVRQLDGDGLYNASGVVITVTDPTHFTYPNAGANEATIADTNGRVDANGIYQFDDPTNLWVWMADAPFEQLEQRIADQEALTNDFGSEPINAGDLFYANGLGIGRGGWDSRRHLRHRVANPQIWPSTDLYQVLVTPIGGVQAGISKVVASDKLTVSQSWVSNQSIACALTRNRVNPHGGFEMEFVATASGSAIDHLGVGIGFQTVPPATDNTFGTLDVNFEGLVWRANGAITVYKRDGIAVGTIITATVLGGTPPWKLGTDVLGIAMSFDEAGETGTFALSINGSIQNRGSLAGFVPGAMYAGPLMRCLGGTIEMRKFLAASPNDGVKRNWYVDPSVGSTGNGTVKNPWRDYRDAVAEDNSDPSQGYYEIVQKRGICLTAPSFDGKKVREVIIRSAAGHGAYIYNAGQYLIGSNPFTRPEPATYPNVWQIPLPSDFTASSSLIDASSTQPNGRTGLKVTPFKHLSRAAFDTPLATLQANMDWSTIHNTGPYTRRLLFSQVSDPNTKNWYLMRGAGIEVKFTSDAQFNGARLVVEGMGFGFCHAGGIVVERGRLEASDFHIFGTTGPGIEVNEGDYRLYGGLIEGTQQDNFNNQGGLTPPADRKLQGQIFGTRLFGCPVGLLGGAVFGDCFSNHSGHEVYIDGAEAFCGAKDGFSCLGRFTVKDTIIEDCVQAAVEMAVVQEASGFSGRVIGGRYSGNGYGVLITQDHPSSNVLELDGGTVFDSNVTASMRLTKLDGQATLRARHWATMGATPALGHISNPTGGIVQALTPINLGSF